jgi:hypothetical protein
MQLMDVMKKRQILQQYENWYVLDDEFSWDVKSLYKSFFKHIEAVNPIPVVFCTINEANKIISDMGDEEDETLRFASGLYWRELGIVFIFDFEEYIPLMETLFHEFRHVMQDQNHQFRHHFETDKHLPYKERITEIDAFRFAKEKINELMKAI